MQNVEFIEAPLAFEQTLVVFSFHFIHDVPIEVLWVAHGEFESKFVHEDIRLFLILHVDFRVV